MEEYISAIENAINIFDVDELREFLSALKESETKLEEYLNDIEDFLKAYKKDV